MSVTKTRRPAVSDQETHEESLRAVAAVLAQPHAYDHVLAMREAGTIDPALADHALDAASVRRSTTISLQMTETAACDVLHVLISTMGDLWCLTGIDGLPSEDDLTWIGAHSTAITTMAHAMARPSFTKGLRAKTPPAKRVQQEHDTPPADADMQMDIGG